MFQALPVDEVVNEAKEESQNEDDVGKPPANKKPKLIKNVNQQKLETRNIPFVKVPKYKNEFRNVTIRLLKDTLNRFRLTGPECGQILSKTLRLSNIDISKDQSKWWNSEFLSNPDLKKDFEAQKEFWTDAGRVPPGEILLSGFVLGLTVRDPRAFLPQKKESVPEREEGEETYHLLSFLTCRLKIICDICFVSFFSNRAEYFLL